MKKRNRQKDKALTNNQTPTETLFNEETASELVSDQPKKKANKSQTK